MSLFSLGKVTVTTPGTTVQLSATSINVNAIYFQALSGNTKYLYVGTKTMVRATLAGVYRQIPAPTAATGLTIALPFWDLVSSVFTGPFDLSQIYLDADNGTEGLLVSYVA
jgi:hypothetical protein